MSLVLITAIETPQPRWEFGWYPGMHSRYPLFTPVQPIPEFATAADASALGLPDTGITWLRHCAFQDMTVEAWEQAGGFAFPKQLMIVYRPHESPEAPRAWVEAVREEIRQVAGGLRRRSVHWGLGPPLPFGLPEAPAGVIEAVRRGEATALTAWADALDRAGATEGAALLRWLPHFGALLAAEVRAVSPQFGFIIHQNRSETAWWWIGDMCSESDNEEARRLGRLMRAWNEMHPAVEWLLRFFGFPHAVIDVIRHETDENLPTQRIDLAAGEHLGPVDADARVLKLDVPGWLPIEGLPEGV